MTAPPTINNFDGGSNGSTILTTDRGSGTGWDQAVVTTATLIYSNAQKHTGGLCFEITQPATGTNTYVGWTTLGSLTTNVYGRFYIYLAALPNVSTYIWRYNNSAAASCAHLKITTAGFIQAENAANGAINTGAKAIPTNEWVRIELRVKASTTVGEFEWAMFSSLSPGDGVEGTRPTETINAAATQVLAANIDGLKFGQPTTGYVTSQTLRFDDVAVSTNGWIGPEFPPARFQARPLIPRLAAMQPLYSPAMPYPVFPNIITVGGTTFPQALDATVTSTATIVRQVNKFLTATVTSTATVVKLVSKALTATVTSTATITALKVILKALTATVSSTATIRRQVNKLMQATVTSTATIQALKVILKALTATVTSTSTMTRKVFTAVTATVSSTATMVKLVTHRLTATVTSAASLVATFIAAGSGAIVAGVVDIAHSILNMVGLGDAETGSTSAQDAPGADATIAPGSGADAAGTEDTGADVTITEPPH